MLRTMQGTLGEDFDLFGKKTHFPLYSTHLIPIATQLGESIVQHKDLQGFGYGWRFDRAIEWGLERVGFAKSTPVDFGGLILFKTTVTTGHSKSPKKIEILKFSIFIDFFIDFFSNFF